MILVIDNYDSFVYNLARHIERLGCPVRVVRNDAVTAEQVEQMQPQAVVLSPGPCTPDEAGVSHELVRRLHRTVPMLGVCLGHQSIAQALGGRVTRADAPWHGRASAITHSAAGLFSGIPSPLTVGRYHSLVVDPRSLPAQIDATAWTTDGATVMALAHRTYPVFGVQFHPESILTQHGYQLLKNFLTTAGIHADNEPAGLAVGEYSQEVATYRFPSGPITF
jgi:anthranilate synthase/aminodeoxychorismate synthase-like glutamine amidotransferase